MKSSQSSLTARLYTAFALVLLVTLTLAVFAITRVNSIATTVENAESFRRAQLEPLYQAREALDQGLSMGAMATQVAGGGAPGAGTGGGACWRLPGLHPGRGGGRQSGRQAGGRFGRGGTPDHERQSHVADLMVGRRSLDCDCPRSSWGESHHQLRESRGRRERDCRCRRGSQHELRLGHVLGEPGPALRLGVRVGRRASNGGGAQPCGSTVLCVCAVAEAREGRR